ncbi:hypothetical protein RND81_01G145300 [Saponaria officinalis]|uniref:Protein RDM1 n=1 Tax=Saponaria officinalis TaxID=3572 RepID=A0AAW1N7R3_SAPOF
MTQRPLSVNDQVDLVSSDDDGDMEVDAVPSGQKIKSEAGTHQSAVTKATQGSVLKKAKMYQEYMKNLPIPKERGSVILCNTWMGLAKSMKELYGQPLHYLTNVLLKQWDQARFETCDDNQSLDTVIHPLKAESTVWLVEDVHRRTASYHHLSKLWLRDPMYHAFVDPIFPKI